MTTAVLSCHHMTEVPEGTTMPDTATCPASGYEREIDHLTTETTGETP